MLGPPRALCHKSQSTPPCSLTSPLTARLWAASPLSCLQSSKDSRKHPCSEHWRERIWLSRFLLLQNYSRGSVSGYVWTSQATIALVASLSTRRNLKVRTAFWSIQVGFWHLVHGKCWTQQKQFPVFHLHCKIDWLDGKHVVFGKVKEGMNIMEAMECFGYRNGKTSKNVTIADCGSF